jgi:two-component sensor histidine kinase
VNLSSILRPLSRDRPWQGIVVGAALFGLAGVARWNLGGLAEGSGPMLLLPSILLGGVVGGVRVGLGVTVVCFLVAWTWYFPPYGTFVLDRRHTVTIVAFILTAGLELYVVRVLKLAIDELSVARERSATMFRELQHRVANNLQVVSSLLHQERKKLDPDSPGFQALSDAQQRLDLMIRVHRSLHSPSVVDLPLGIFLENLAGDLIKSSNTPNIHLTVNASPVALDVERLMSVSMIVAEAVTNALKHAFKNRGGGNLSIIVGLDGRTYDLAINDDGPGFEPGAITAQRDSLGVGIMKSLVRQLDGKLSFEDGPGATVRVIFPRSG